MYEIFYCHCPFLLVWGNSTLTELKLVWMNITTYQPYVNETSFENLIYLNEAGTDFVSLSSLRNIFKPLASRVKKIFQIIAKDRLENANNRQYKGISIFIHREYFLGILYSFHTS